MKELALPAMIVLLALAIGLAWWAVSADTKKHNAEVERRRKARGD